MRGTGDEMAIINGSSRVNRLRGTADADIMTGFGGSDSLFGGLGDDILYGDDAGSTAPFGFGNDVLSGGGGADILVGGAGNDRLSGGGGDDVLIGGFAAASAGGTYSVPLAIDSGNDSYSGGAGIDLAVLVFDRVAGITLDLSNPRRSAAILAADVEIGTIAGVERLRFHGGVGGDVVTGGALDDHLAGGAGDDVLRGGDGNDRVLGGTGDDLLDGGAGFDVVSYEDAASGVTIDLRLTGTEQATGAGRDTLIGFEQLDGSAFDDWLIGSDGTDFLSGGSGGNDRLEGGAGNDNFYQYRTASVAATATTIYGGAGDDLATLAGEAGAHDRLTFFGGGDADEVHVSGGGQFRLVMGGGEDRVGITLGEGAVVVVLGGGVDTVVLETRTDLPDRWQVPVIADFMTGDDGDRIDLRGWLAAEAIGYVANSDPFAGFTRLVAAGGDTLVQVDRDAAGGAFAFETVLRLENTVLTAFTAFNFGGFDPNGALGLI